VTKVCVCCDNTGLTEAIDNFGERYDTYCSCEIGRDKRAREDAIYQRRSGRRFEKARARAKGGRS